MMSDEEVMALSDEYFVQTQAFRAFRTKECFIRKIHPSTRAILTKLPSTNTTTTTTTTTTPDSRLHA